MRATIPRVLYLHGFASGPTSSKAQAFRRRFEALGYPVDIPTLDEGDFEHLTLTKQRALVTRAMANEQHPRVIIGSSMGGYLAALHASEHPVDALVLMAPAVDFARRMRERYGDVELARWERDGVAEVDHYAPPRRARLSVEFLHDASRHEPWPRISAPTLVFAGRFDDVVPLPLVERWVADTPSARLVVFDDGHELVASIDRILDESQAFLAAL